MGKILVKSGVDFGRDFAPAGARILEELKALVANYDFDVTITAARDAVHSETQLSGEVFDLGALALSEGQKRRVIADLQFALGEHFGVRLEMIGTMGEHISVFCRKQTPYSVFDFLVS